MLRSSSEGKCTNTLGKATQKTFRWMLEPTVNNCPKKLRFQEKVSEARTVYPNITPAITNKLQTDKGNYS